MPLSDPGSGISHSSKRTLLVSDLSVLLVAVIWGSSYVVMQEVGESVPAASFLALRFLTALPVIILMSARTLPRLTRSEVTSGTFFGTLLFLILILETVGVKHTSAANAGFLITVSVVLIPLLERIISRRRQRAVVYGATVTALVGCGLLVLEGGFRPQPGDLIILGAALVRATQITLFGRRSGASRAQSLTNLTLVEFVVVCLLAGTLSGFTSVPVWDAAGSVSLENWLLICYLGVLGTSYAFFIQLRAARGSSSTRVGLILATEPLFAAVFAVAAAGEHIGLIQGTGGAMIVLAALVGRRFEGRPVGKPRPARPGNADEPSRTPSAEEATEGQGPVR
ncbi:DMT family transporter [Streptomyces xinghaiensis]|uniref:DMT family transporter n=1 Tax=Streptomyces xinghaiensis TaxID=1038928 RepID=UPI0034262DAB